MSGPITTGLDRLADWIKVHSDIDRPFRLCRVVDTLLWSPSGPSYVAVEWEGTERLAVYRDGPRPLDGQYLQVVRFNHKPNSALLALPLPQQYRRRTPFLYAAYDTSGNVSPNDDAWSIIAGRRDNGHWVKRADNPITAGVFADFGAGSRLRMKCRALDNILWAYPDLQGGEVSFADVANAYTSDDDGLTWNALVGYTGVIDWVIGAWMIAGGGTELWSVLGGLHVTPSPANPGPHVIAGAPTALRILSQLNYAPGGDPSNQYLYLMLGTNTGYYVVSMRKPAIVDPVPANNRWVLDTTLGPFGYPGGAGLADQVVTRGFADLAGPGINSSLTGSFVVLRVGPNKQTYRAKWSDLIAGGGWSSWVGTSVPAGAAPRWQGGGPTLLYQFAVNPGAPWVTYIQGNVAANVPDSDPRRMVDDTEVAFQSTDAPGELAPFFSQSGSGDLALAEAYVKANLSVARSIRTTYAVVGPGLGRGGQWDYDFPNGTRGPKLIAAISDPTLGGSTAVDDSEYMDEDLGNQYALWPFSSMFIRLISGGLDWWEGLAAGELG